MVKYRFSIRADLIQFRFRNRRKRFIVGNDLPIINVRADGVHARLRNEAPEFTFKFHGFTNMNKLVAVY